MQINNKCWFADWNILPQDFDIYDIVHREKVGIK